MIGRRRHCKQLCGGIQCQLRVYLFKHTANETFERTTGKNDLGLEPEDPNKRLKEPSLLPKAMINKRFQSPFNLYSLKVFSLIYDPYQGVGFYKYFYLFYFYSAIPSRSSGAASKSESVSCFLLFCGMIKIKILPGTVTISIGSFYIIQ